VFINLKTDPRILHSSPCHAWHSDFCSHPRSDATWTPAHDPTRSSVSIRTTNSRNSTRMSARASARTSVSQFVLQVRAHTFRPRSDLCPCPRYSCIYKSEPSNSAWTSMSHFILQVQACTFGPCSDLHPHPRYDPNPCHPTPHGCPLRHPCLTLSYKFKPMPLGPTRTSILVYNNT
jgi:hypothetical protein